MRPIETVATAIREIDSALEDPTLEPDRSRDWRLHRDRVDALANRFESDVVTPFLHGAGNELNEAQRAGLRAKIGFMAAELAATLSSAGREARSTLVARALEFTDGADEIRAASLDMNGYVNLIHARWLLRHGRDTKAKKILRALERGRNPQLAAAARAAWNAPRPMGQSAPPLFRLNGFGFGLYGARDREDDGSHIATYCLSALWVPVFPLTAYRIVDHGDNRISFLAKARLSGFARFYQKFVAVAAVALIGVSAVNGYLESPERQASMLLAEARQEMEAGNPAAAEETLESILMRHGTATNADYVEEAAIELVKLWTAPANIPEPFVPSGVTRVDHVVQRFQRLPIAVKNGAAAELLVDKLITWTTALGDDRDPKTHLHLLEAALRLTRTRRQDLRSKIDEVRVVLADALAPDWPIRALEMYLSLNDQLKAAAGAGSVVDVIASNPLLVLDAEPQIDRWLGLAAKTPSEIARMERVKVVREEALALSKDEQRRALLEKPNSKQFARYLAQHPSDQALILAKAEAHGNLGRFETARDMLLAVGKPGHLFQPAQLELARLHFQLGDFAKAEELWEHVLALRLPRFQATRKRHLEAIETVRDRLVAAASSGRLPKTLQIKLDNAKETERPAIFQEHLNEQLAADAKVRATQEEYGSFSDVVPISVSLGTAKLRRANEAAGEERRTLLDGAEKVFLSIGDAAEGLPEYHLGLGQVYHRLGRQEDGNREFEHVLSMNEPELSLSVAQACRELGLMTRSREIALAVWEGKSRGAKDAAVLMSVLAKDNEEKELWLTRADQDTTFVRRSLLEVRAVRMMHEGRFEEADRVLQEAEHVQEVEAKHNASAANNAALVARSRFLCTGVSSHLDRAAAGLEHALRLRPDSGLIAGNLADVVDHQAMLESLDGWIDVSLLRVTLEDAETLLYAIRSGALADEVDRALDKSARFRRARDLTAMEEALAPTRPNAFQRELRWYTLRENTASLRSLRDRLANGAMLEVSDAEDTQREDPAETEKWIKAHTQLMAWRDAAVRRAAAKRQAPTLAAAQLLRAETLHDFAVLKRDVEMMTSAVASYREAKATWPSLNVEPVLAQALLSLAMLRGALQSPGLEKALAEHPKRESLDLLVLNLAASAEGLNLLRAVSNQADVLEAVALRKAAMHESPDLRDWVLAIVSQDTEFRKWASSMFAHEGRRLSAEIRARFTDRTELAKRALALFEAQAG